MLETVQEMAMTFDYDAAYDNRGAVPEHPQIFRQWADDAAAFRDALKTDGRAELDIPYGPSPRQYLDLFKAKDADAPLALFIHGGYWRALDPKFHSHLARGLNARGVTVAVAGYDLCPQVGIADIIEEMRAAALFLWRRFGKRITAYGHSAGGHLAATLIATDWSRLDPKAPSDLVPAGYSISGVFDLTPLIHTSMNADFKLDEASARAASPLFWLALGGRALDSVVGGAELPEFIRQAKSIVNTWPRDKVQMRYEEFPGTNHFTVLTPLTDPDSAMTSRLVELTARTRDWRDR
jgi:arylformamidase